MMAHVKSLWFLFWVIGLVLGAVAASGVIHVDAWQKLAASLVIVFNTITAFLAAQWQAPARPDAPAPPVDGGAR